MADPVMDAGAVADDVSVDTSVDTSSDVDTGLDTSADVSQDVAQDTDASSSRTDDQPALETQDAAGDGRVIPGKWRELFKTDKDLKAQFFENRALKQHFPGGVNEALKVKETVDSLGGEDGIAAIQAERQSFAAIDEKFNAADPKYIDEVAQQNPESFGKLIPHALEKFQQLDTPGYQHLMARVFFNTLQANGFMEAVRALKQAAGDNKDVQAIAGDLEGWAGGIRDLASRQPERKVDPEREKLQTERQQFEQEKFQSFQRAVGVDIGSHIDASIERNLGEHLKTRGIEVSKLRKDNPEDYAILVQNVDHEIGKVLTANKTYVQQRDSILKQMDKDKSVKFLKQNVDRVIGDAVKKVYRAFYTLGGGKQVATQKTDAVNAQKKDMGTGASGGVKRSAQPKEDEIDYSRTSRDDIWNNRAVLKNGSKVSWQ